MKTIDRLLKRIDNVLESERKLNPREKSFSGSFNFGHYNVRYVFRPSGIELEIYNCKKETFLDNVASLLERKCLDWQDIDVDESYNEWDEHGFRDESDYLNYRYG